MKALLISMIVATAFSVSGCQKSAPPAAKSAEAEKAPEKKDNNIMRFEDKPLPPPEKHKGEL